MTYTIGFVAPAGALFEKHDVIPVLGNIFAKLTRGKDDIKIVTALSPNELEYSAKQLVMTNG